LSWTNAPIGEYESLSRWWLYDASRFQGRIMLVSLFGRCLSIATLATGLLGACHSGMGSEYPESPEAKARSVIAAVEDVVGARCDFDERCNKIGPGQTYESRDTCESKLQGTTASELNTKDCPLGVDDRKLETCLAAIRAEECSSIMDSLTRWNSCRSGQVCYH
jgi:hypothetical protein